LKSPVDINRSLTLILHQLFYSITSKQNIGTVVEWACRRIPGILLVDYGMFKMLLTSY